MKMVVTGISKEAAKDLIERLYGACMWGIEDRGITCYPTGEIEVVLTSESREDQFSGDTDCAGRIAGRHSFTGNGGTARAYWRKQQMKAVIKWQGGEHVIEDAALGDSRVAEFLDQLAERKAQGVTLTFEDDFLNGAELIGDGER